MARSTYIYIVTCGAPGLPAAAFTVKWEMKAWVKRNGLTPESTRVHRFTDNPGPGSVPARVSNEEVFG